MSVLKSRRHESELRVLNKAYNLTDHTLNKLEDKNKFPKNKHWLYGRKMEELCLEISSNIKRANRITVDAKNGDPLKLLKKRLEYQEIALSACDALYEYVERAYVHLPLSGRETDAWTGMIVEVENGINNWRRSDIEKYRKQYIKIG